MVESERASKRPRGALKSAIEARLLDADRAMTARELRESFAASSRPAATTVLTVLDRMYRSGEVERAKDAHGDNAYRLPALAPAETAATMMETLLRSSDRTGALLRLAGSLSPAEVESLRAALDRKSGGA